MTTRITGSFRIQWHDGDDDKDGSFKGRAERHDDWQSLDNFELTEGGTYTFYMSVCSGLTYTTFVRIVESDGPDLGVRIDPNMTDDDPNSTNGRAVTVGPVTLGNAHLELTAARLSGDDPKVQVSWGSGKGNITVSMTWDGRSWSVSGATKIAPNQWSAETADSVTFDVRDTSSHVATAFICELASMTALYGDICPSTTISRPSNTNTSYYSINLYDALQDPGRVSVTSP